MNGPEVIAGMLLGNSRHMRDLREKVARVAVVPEPVLVQGATGTGKELVVTSLHLLSRRAGKLVTVNTPAIPETTFEATLFGHTKGAFTGAQSDLPGMFGEARGGTLFLDEIGAFPLSLQPKLLRASETMCYRPVGGREDAQGDFRLVSAANEDLEVLVERGGFRPDLLERIGAVRIDVPELRDHIEDVPILVEHFVAQAVVEGYPAFSFSADAVERLMEFEWPRNVRQLKNVVRRAALLGSSSVSPNQVARLLGDTTRGVNGNGADDPDRMRLEALLDESSWDVAAVARGLGMGRSTLYRTLRALGIKRPPHVRRRLGSVPAPKNGNGKSREFPGNPGTE